MSAKGQATCPLCYYSQAGQDRFADETVFLGKRNGVFVEIGASDGVTFSNSLFFERFRGWTGVCVEPIPARFEELKSNRICTCIQGCVGAESGTVRFSVVKDSDLLSGIRPKSNGRDDRCLESVDVPMYTPDEIFSLAGHGEIDICSIDTEGTELDILRAMNFSRWKPRCLILEDNDKKLAMIVLLHRHGYRLVKRLGADLVFVERSLAASLSKEHLLGIEEIIRRIFTSITYRLSRKVGRNVRETETDMT